MVGGRAGVEHDPVRRPGRGGAVRDVDVVAQDDVDPAGRSLAELRGEFPMSPLRQIARPPAQRLQMLGKGDAKVLGLDRTPRFVRRNLRSRRRGRQQTNERCDWDTGRGTMQAVYLPGRPASSTLPLFVCGRGRTPTPRLDACRAGVEVAALRFRWRGPSLAARATVPAARRICRASRARYRADSIEFKRQIAQEFLGGESLNGLPRRDERAVERWHLVSGAWCGAFSGAFLAPVAPVYAPRPQRSSLILNIEPAGRVA